MAVTVVSLKSRACTSNSVTQVMILITGVHKSLALAKAVEEGVNHMWTVSAFQQHAQALFVCDEDATLELRVKTVKYFKVSTTHGPFRSPALHCEPPETLMSTLIFFN